MLTRPPLRVAVLCSHRAPGLIELLERDPNRGRLYEVVAVITSELAFDGQTRVGAHGVPTRAHAIHEFYRRRRAEVYRDFRVRADFDRATVAILARFAPDLVLLDGYLYILTGELLDAYPGRVINLHFSDLRLRHPDGRPRYPGIRAVRDALLDGRRSTRATVHLVNEEPDGGAPLVESWSFPVSALASDALAVGAREMFKAYVFAHQEWMIRTAAEPLLASTLRLIADRTLDLGALAAVDPAAITPFTVDPDGHITYRHAA